VASGVGHERSAYREFLFARFVGAGNTRTTDVSTIVTPLLQNNSHICDMNFTHTRYDRAEFLCVGTRHSALGFAASRPEGSNTIQSRFLAESGPPVLSWAPDFTAL
jgi:hypothetical protein